MKGAVRGLSSVLGNTYLHMGRCVGSHRKTKSWIPTRTSSPFKTGLKTLLTSPSRLWSRPGSFIYTTAPQYPQGIGSWTLHRHQNQRCSSPIYKMPRTVGPLYLQVPHLQIRRANYTSKSSCPWIIMVCSSHETLSWFFEGMDYLSFYQHTPGISYSANVKVNIQQIPDE